LLACFYHPASESNIWIFKARMHLILFGRMDGWAKWMLATPFCVGAR
jgi:hypothetical protein